jgi:multicomponent Na+:H+ antiporter subunit B
MLMGIYSLLSAAWMLTLDAPDVAFTEAAVGAGISTVLALATLALTTREEKRPDRRSLLPLLIAMATGAVLIYGTFDMPFFGDPNAPANLHVAPRYIADSPEEIGVPNMVTAVLASYRGYDTLGETTVILTAGVVVLLLMRRRVRGGLG